MSNEVRVTDALTGGEKGSKPERFDLIPVEAMKEVARVYGYGAEKYALRNWEKGYDWGLSIAAAERHWAEFKNRNSFDDESTLHHLAHHVFHCLALMTWEANGKGTDSRTELTKPIGWQRRVPPPLDPQHADPWLYERMNAKAKAEAEFVADHEYVER